MRKRLTKPVCNSKPPADSQQRLEIWDTDLPGFGIRIWKSPGRKDLKDPAERTFFIMYRDAGDKLRRYTIGSFHKISLKDARETARDEFAKISRGDYPHIRKRRAKLKSTGKIKPDTWGDLIDRFIKSGVGAKGGKLRESTAKEYGRILKKEVLPIWKDWSRDEVSKDDVRALVDTKRDDVSDFAANRLLSAISSLCSWAVWKGHLETSPCAGLKQTKERDLARRRVLDEPETRAFWKACQDEGYPYGTLLQMALVIGQRPFGEIGGMRWPEVDKDNAKWAIPAERIKTNQDHLIPLPQLALDILEAVPQFEDQDLVFGEVRSSSKINSRILSRMKEYIAKETGKEPDKVKLDHFQPRDLRRTVRTRLAELGVLEEIGERILSHSRGDKGVVGVYNRASYLPQMRDALNKWNDKLQGVVSDKPSKVRAIHG